MKLICLVSLLFVSLTAAYAQPVLLPRAKAPLTLVDLSKPEVLARWSGLKVAAATLGDQPAMRFDIPKYVQGENEWPAVYLSYAEGKGLASMDWRHYGKLVWDVQTDAAKNSGITLELRPKAEQNGWTLHFELKPGVNHLELPLADITKEVDVSHLEQIVFFTSHPPDPYTLTVANIKLLPGDKPPLATVALAYPNYRQLIFPTVDRVSIAVRLQPEEYDLNASALKLTLECRAGGKTVSTETALTGQGGTYSISTRDLPAGEVVAIATVTGAPEPVRLRFGLRKLTPEEVKAFKTYIDEHNNTIVDGKPFFPLGWYDGVDYGHLKEIADSPFNCLLDYGTNSKSQADMLKYLDEVQRLGLKLIYCNNDVYPAAKYYEGKTWEGVTGNQNIADAVVKAYRDHPAILAWYLDDELPRSMASDLRDYYLKARNGDPNHPCYIVLCTMADLRYMVGTTDIMGVDPYPIPSTPVTHVSDWMEAANGATDNLMPTWLVPQAFAWYQYNPEGSNRGRVPTEQELKTGRAPTYEEERCMTYLALAHGAKGLIYYCYYDLRVLPQYQEMWGWMKSIAAEVKELSPVLLSPDDLGPARFTPATAPIHTKLKRCNGHEYLIAVNAGKDPCEITFESRRALPAQVTVMFENRTTPAAGKTLKLAFKPLEVHVLDLGPIGR